MWRTVYFVQLSIPVRPDLLAGLRHVWEALAAPGTWWTGAERVGLAAAARGAPTDEIPRVAAGAARLIYADVTATSREWFDGVLGAGVSMAAFVELVGVVSRLAAVDQFVHAIGHAAEPLPVPQPGDSAGAPLPKARPGRARVPMAGPMSITRALSLVPPESEAQEALSGVLYMSYAEMDEQDFERELTRPQMELIASRVSALNECFY